MARTPTYPLGLPDEQRAAWQRDADAAGLSLAEYIRRCVETVRRQRLVLDAEGGMPPGSLSAEGRAVHAARASDLSVFKGMHPKVPPKRS